jgi:hypothetical protein
VRWGEWFTQTRWADRDDAPLEQRLDEVFAEIVHRVGDAQRVAGEKRAGAEQAAAQEREQTQAREREWAQHMARARERYLDAARAEALRGQVSAREEAQRVRSYCDALDAAHPQDAGVQARIGWARAYADELDPVGKGPGMPELEEPAPGRCRPICPRVGARGGLSARPS